MSVVYTVTFLNHRTLHVERVRVGEKDSVAAALHRCHLGSSGGGRSHGGGSGSSSSSSVLRLGSGGSALHTTSSWLSRLRGPGTHSRSGRGSVRGGSRGRGSSSRCAVVRHIVGSGVLARVLVGAVTLRRRRQRRGMRVGAILKHAQTVLSVLAGVQVVVLKTVHLAVTLCAASADGAHVRARALLGFLERETVVDRVMDSKVALTVNVSLV